MKYWHNTYTPLNLYRPCHGVLRYWSTKVIHRRMGGSPLNRPLSRHMIHYTIDPDIYSYTITHSIYKYYKAGQTMNPFMVTLFV